MNLKVLITLLILLAKVHAMDACGCGGPRHELAVDIDSSEAIFLGVVLEISLNHKFHLNDGNGLGLQYINFEILKIYQGINPAQLRITIFDSASNTSCEGLHFGKSVGDTVLVFANEFKPEMLGSYICGRHRTLQQLDSNEQVFLAKQPGHDPRVKHSDHREYQSKHFVTEGTSSSSHHSHWRWALIVALAISILVNALLLVKKQIE